MSGSESDEPNDMQQSNRSNDSDSTNHDHQLPNAAAAVKNRVTRKLTEKGKHNKIIELKSRLCKLVNEKLIHYGKVFSTIDQAEFAKLEQNLDVLEQDAIEIRMLHDELNKLLDNKTDEEIESMCSEFHRERDHNLNLIIECMTEIEQHTDEAAKREAEEAEKEIAHQLQLVLDDITIISFCVDNRKLKFQSNTRFQNIEIS